MQPNASEAVAAGQDAVFEVAIQLARLDRKLAQISTSLPLPADVDDLFEDRVPSSPAAQLYSVIGALKVDLHKMVEILLEASQVDEVALRREFRKWEGGRR